MGCMTDSERLFCRCVSDLSYSNPFLPERIEHERELLGTDFAERGPVWDLSAKTGEEHPNIVLIGERVEAVADALRGRLASGDKPNSQERVLYEDLILYLLFHRTRNKLYEYLIAARDAAGRGRPITFYDDFERDARHFFAVPSVRGPERQDPAHVFACFFQIRRAFHFIHYQIVGASMPAARLRAAVWRSVFTHDMRRYRRTMYARMGDITTLVTGPSGTGKELVARAIGMSRYIPFDPQTRTFREEDFEGSFYPLNLSALSPTLIESELFGHRRGSFTGALEDRAGWLEVCPPLGTVFLDEIGDVSKDIQVKLLRVLETRLFQRIGDTKPLPFRGKIVAATNRDPVREMREGRMREDFYYRLCSDMVVTPSLREQIADSPAALGKLLLFIAKRIVGEDAESVAAEVEEWIKRNLGADYPWPGNVRELEQCVRNVLIREEYRPAPARSRPPVERIADDFRHGATTADELLRRYCTLVYAVTGSYAETARRLKLDRRTVRSKVDPALLGELQRPGRPPGNMSAGISCSWKKAGGARAGAG